jgi:hypothetical protein
MRVRSRRHARAHPLKTMEAAKNGFPLARE